MRGVNIVEVIVVSHIFLPAGNVLNDPEVSSAEHDNEVVNFHTIHEDIEDKMTTNSKCFKDEMEKACGWMTALREVQAFH